MGQETKLDVTAATHWLECRHCLGRNVTRYNMKAAVLGETASGKVKVLVFGDRNWKDKDHIKRVRYVPKYRLTKMAKN
jgi:hypothetical protein